MNERALPLVNPRSVTRRIVGALCGLVFLGALIALGVWSGGWLRERREFVVRIPAASELTKSSPVRLLGQAVGRVSAVRVVEHAGRPVVEARFWIAGAQAGWMRDNTAVIVRSSLMGATSLDLKPASEPGNALRDDAVVEAQIETGMIDRVLEVQPVIEQLIAQVGGLVATLDATVKRVDPILVQAEQQLGMTKASLEEITGLVADARVLFAAWKEDQEALVSGVTATLNQVNTELLPGIDTTVRGSQQSVTAAFGELNQTLDLVQSRLPGLFDVAEATLANTRDMTEALNHTWPFNSYWKRKAKEEAAAAARAKAGR